MGDEAEISIHVHDISLYINCVLQQPYEFNPNCWIWLVAMANERLIFLVCNIYSIWLNMAFIAVHSGERCGPWASGSQICCYYSCYCIQLAIYLSTDLRSVVQSTLIGQAGNKTILQIETYSHQKVFNINYPWAVVETATLSFVNIVIKEGVLLSSFLFCLAALAGGLHTICTEDLLWHICMH